MRRLAVTVACLGVLAGCGGKSPRSYPVPEVARVAADLDRTWEAVHRVLTERGYALQSEDRAAGVIETAWLVHNPAYSSSILVTKNEDRYSDCGKPGLGKADHGKDVRLTVAFATRAPARRDVMMRATFRTARIGILSSHPVPWSAGRADVSRRRCWWRPRCGCCPIGTRGSVAGGDDGEAIRAAGSDRDHDLSVGGAAEQGPRGGCGEPLACGGTLRAYLESLPNQLAVRTLREVVRAIVTARRTGKPVLVGMGAHVIKVGLSPILIDLAERGVVTAVALNGACAVHDFELATVGWTSEDVEVQLAEGEFGMAEETGRVLNEAVIEGAGGVSALAARWASGSWR